MPAVDDIASDTLAWLPVVPMLPEPVAVMSAAISTRPPVPSSRTVYCPPTSSAKLSVRLFGSTA
jgi:hypothetical protein